MDSKLLEIANRYALGLQRVQKRKESWTSKHTEIKEHLTAVASELNSQAGYKQGFFVDSMHAFDEEIHASCAELQSLVFRSGDMPMHVSFCNDKGEKKDLVEHGFQVTFTPSVTGEIFIFFTPHSSDLNTSSPAVAPLGIFNDPSAITPEHVDTLLAKAMEMAFFTSFTGVAEQLDEAEKPHKTVNIPHHNPIGFKRYETTEKAK